MDVSLLSAAAFIGTAFGYMVRALVQSRKEIRGFNGDKQEITERLNELGQTQARNFVEFQDICERLATVESSLKILKRRT